MEVDIRKVWQEQCYKSRRDKLEYINSSFVSKKKNLLIHSKL